MKIELIKTKEHKNGDVTYNFDVDKDFKKAVKVKYYVKRFTKKLAKKFIIDAIYSKMLEDLNEDRQKAYKLNNIKEIRK